MPRRCSVKKCKGVLKDNIKSALFRAPKDCNISAAWNQAVSKANGKSSIAKYVCQNHFLTEDIISEYINFPRDLIFHDIAKRNKCSLKQGAIPSIFDTLIKQELIEETMPNDECIAENNIEDIDVDITNFNNLFTSYKNMRLPNSWLSYGSEKAVTFYSMKHTYNDFQNCIAVIEKQITVTSKQDIRFYVFNNYEVNYEDIIPNNKLKFPLNVKDLEKSITHFNAKDICDGGPNKSTFPGIRVQTASLCCFNKNWRHMKCPIIITSGKRCSFCKNLFSSFRANKKRTLDAIKI